jgi:hypothetical protein
VAAIGNKAIPLIRGDFGDGQIRIHKNRECTPINANQTKGLINFPDEVINSAARVE